MRKRFSGKNLYRAPLLLGATLMLSACGLWQDGSESPAQPETSPDMQVEVKLRALHRCSRISPEMVVTNVPKGTDYFDVRRTSRRNACWAAATGRTTARASSPKAP